MSQLFTKFRTAALLTLLLAGCDNSDIKTVKNATVPQDKTHTYDTALSRRALERAQTGHPPKAASQASMRQRHSATWSNQAQFGLELRLCS